MHQCGNIIIHKIILVKVIQKYNLYITNGEMPDYLSIQGK